MDKKILLIEDDAFVLDLYKTVLTKAGYQLSVAGDGEKAVEVAQSNEFDLILLDIMLPKLTGLDVLRKLRNEIPQHKETFVYLLTNLGEEKVVQEAYKIGANGYLLKAKYLPKQVVEEVDKFFTKTTKPNGDIGDGMHDGVAVEPENVVSPSDSN